MWYYFKYQAINTVTTAGLKSEFSTVYRMMPGTAPSAPANSPRLVAQNNTDITFRVISPSHTGGPPVVRYEVEI